MFRSKSTGTSAQVESYKRLSRDGDRADWVNIYKMTHARRGKMIIVNNETFHRHLGWGVRRGTDVDADNLKAVFEALHFQVIVVKNQTTTQMLQLVIDVSNDVPESHESADCFAMAILSHGEDGVIYGVDDAIEIDKLIEPLKGNQCKSLIGKPKLFFFQACRGTKLDDGLDQHDGSSAYGTDSDDSEDGAVKRVYRIPIEADFFYAYSTPPGHYAFRNANTGSWFVQAIKKVFEECGTRVELCHLMTRVNRMVAYDFESHSSNEAHSKKKQVSSIVSMLTKELYFTPK